MLLSLLATVSAVTASTSGALVSAIPVVGTALAEGAATIGAAVGSTAAGLGASTAGAALTSGITTTACNSATLNAASKVMSDLDFLS